MPPKPILIIKAAKLSDLLGRRFSQKVEGGRIIGMPYSCWGEPTELL